MDFAAKYNILGIQVGNLTNNDPDLEKFHTQAQDIISQELARVGAAVKALDPGLQHKARMDRAAAIYAMGKVRLTQRLNDLVESIFGSRLKYSKKIFDAARNPEPADSGAALLFQAKVEAARRQIENLSPDRRIHAADKLARAGDPRFIPIFRDSVNELLPLQVMESLESEYFKSVAGDEGAYVKATQEAAEEAVTIANIAYVALAASSSANGVNFWRLPPVSELISVLPPSIKGAYVARYGQDAYQALLSGARSISEIADLV